MRAKDGKIARLAGLTRQYIQADIRSQPRHHFHMKPSRRGFLGMLAAATLAPERLLWAPGRKLISIPKRVILSDTCWIEEAEIIPDRLLREVFRPVQLYSYSRIRPEYTYSPRPAVRSASNHASLVVLATCIVSGWSGDR